MAVTHSFLSLSLALLLVSVSCSRHNLGRKSTESQYESLGNECDLNRLDAVQPDNRVESEAGVTETWNPNHEQFQCAGVAVQRHTIETQGLLLPSYANAPQLAYVVQGRGLTGMLFSGCPETFQESQGSQQGKAGKYQDQHQRIRRFREGDIIAIPAGVAHWCYNDGNEPVITVNLLHTSSYTNQLDINPRNFYLAGNPRQEFPKQQPGQQGQEWKHEQQGSCNNLFCGMEPRLLAEAFNIDEQTARKLQNEGDYRGNIVRVKEALQVVKPPRTEEERAEQERGSPSRRQFINGLEETFCTMRIKENIGDPATADYYVPEAGYFSLVNKFNLPILDYIGLSAQKGSLYNEALFLPHWHKTAHSILYGIKGQARVQIVDNNGRKLYDGTLGENQVLTIPQNYAAVLRAQSDRFEWVSFNTRAHNNLQPLAGRTSVLRALPVEVVANMYQVSVEDASRIKFNTQETLLRNPKSQSGKRSVA